MKRDALIPSMFHRRLLLLALVFGLVLLVLVGQLFRLTVVHGAEHLIQAERVLVNTKYLPTYRGRIVDRHGVALAFDQPCFDVLVDYKVISGEWAVAQAGREARQVHGKKWNALSRAQRLALIEQYQPRYEREADAVWQRLASISGETLEEIVRRRDAIHARVERMAGAVNERRRIKHQLQYQVQVSIEDVARPIREQEQPHVILEGIAAGEESRYRQLSDEGPRLTDDKPAVTVMTSGTRAYSLRDTSVTLDRSSLPGPLRRDPPLTIDLARVGTQIVGTMRSRIHVDELTARPFVGPGRDGTDLGGYLPRDPIGSLGIERSFEDTLRGRRGVQTRHYDDSPDERLEPIPGRDVHLTIDMSLQARISGILDPRFGLTRVQPWHGDENELPIGTNLASGAVVIEIASGEILAMASSPLEEHPAIARYRAGLDAEARRGLDRWHLRPELYHLAAQVPVAPGSIVKPLFLSWAISHGNWPVNKEVDCQGHFLPETRDILRCWIYRPPTYAVHGPLGPVTAIGRSCNIYFYTIAHTLGIDRVKQVYSDWGMGHDFALGMRVHDQPIETLTVGGEGELVMLGIGQGAVAWTPLHAAAAYAALARGGVYIDPMLVKNNPQRSAASRRDLDLTDEAVFVALWGLNDVVNNQVYGGARHMDVDPPNREYEPIFNVRGVHVWGKTGTAQQQRPVRYFNYLPNGELEVDAYGEPVVVERESGIGAHSWFVGLVGPEDGGGRGTPRYAIAVLVQWGGSGSRCAGPIANQIMHALQDEGYLK